jgi:S1-C subfamily serine protease
MVTGRRRLVVAAVLAVSLTGVLIVLASCGSGTSTSATQPSTTTVAVQTTVTTAPVSTTTTEATTSSAPTTTTSIAQTSSTEPALETPTSAEVHALAKKVSPSVVSVASSFKTAEGTMQVSGSGLVYSADGLIILSVGVASPDGKAPDSITVTLPSGAKKKATLIGQDTASGGLPFGLALLKIAATGLSPVTFSTKTPSKGDWVLDISGVGSKQTAKEWTITGTAAGLLETSRFTLGAVPGGLFDANGDLVGMPVANSINPPEGLTIPAASVLASAKKILGP